MRKRGFTLVEMVLVTALTAMIVGALCSLYAFSTNRAAHAYANYGSLMQARDLMDEIESVVQWSQTVSLVSSGSTTGIRCTMPVNGTDKDGDGYADTYTLTTVNRRGLPKWGTGNRIWFYRSDSTGDFTHSGSVPWRAQRSDGSMPTTSDVDSKFAYYYTSGQSRYSLINGLSFVVDSTAHTVDVTVTTNDLVRREASSAAASDANLSYSLTFTRKIYWRNWRK